MKLRKICAYTKEFLAYNTMLPEMARFASKDFPAAKKLLPIRMHFSRMHTVCWSGRLGWVGGCPE